MKSKLRLDIPVLLPEVDNIADACVARLTSDLEARQGVETVHLVAAKGEKPAKLCVHFDPEVLPLTRIREIAQSAGAQITARFGHLTWNVSGIGHERRGRSDCRLIARIRRYAEDRSSALWSAWASLS